LESPQGYFLYIVTLRGTFVNCEKNVAPALAAKKQPSNLVDSWQQFAPSE
jgi:hypothetical protein